mgnify:FL=1
MISEEALRQAAAEASDCLVRSLDEAGIPAHNFSARFERKMRRLIRRTRHPAAYRALVRVACAFLAFLLGSGVFLAVNPEARAAFFGWVRTQYERLFEYNTSSQARSIEAIKYTLDWLPNGYEEISRYVYTDYVWAIYSDGSENEIDFLYSIGSKLYLSYDHNHVQQIMINDSPANLYISQYSAGRNDIVWSNSDGTIVFSIGGILDTDTLVRIAENVHALSIE